MRQSKSNRRVNPSGQSLLLNKSDISHPAVKNLAAREPEQNVVTSFRWGWYLLSLFVPFAGIFIALLLYDQDSREVRKVGRNCLLISFLIWVVFPVLMFLAFLFLAAIAAFSWVSDMMPAD
jgi:hypothetical protein